MGARNQVGKGLPYRPASLCSLATQFQTCFLKSIRRPIAELKFPIQIHFEVQILCCTVELYGQRQLPIRPLTYYCPIINIIINAQQIQREKYTLAAVLGEGQLHESNYSLNYDSIRQAAQALGSHKAAILPNT
jgi:hypothetical protein